jgi:hypothetical protein
MKTEQLSVRIDPVIRERLEAAAEHHRRAARVLGDLSTTSSSAVCARRQYSAAIA